VAEAHLAFASAWSQGDGEGGDLQDFIAETLQGLGHDYCHSSRTWPRDPNSYAKKRISASLRTRVFERDAYRCCHCGDHRSLTADHIHPESQGGATTFENLQTLCKSCNSKKGTKPDLNISGDSE
jgi:hypothetical protein